MKQRQKMLIAICGILSGIAVLILLINFREFWPGEDMVANLKKTHKKLQKELDEVINRNKIAETETEKLDKESVFFLSVDSSTASDSYMRKKIEEIGKNSEATIKSLSDIRKNPLIKGYYALELTITVEGRLKQVATFINELENSKPRLYFQQCSIRPAGIRDQGKLVVGCTLQLICKEKDEASP